VQVGTYDLVGDAGSLQSQRQRMRLGQSTQRCFVSIDVAARQGLILGWGRRAGLGSRLLASTAARRQSHLPPTIWWSCESRGGGALPYADSCGAKRVLSYEFE
jgi:hypothetical protein